MTSFNIQILKEFYKRDPTDFFLKLPFFIIHILFGRVIYIYSSIKKDKQIIIFTDIYYTGNTRAVYERMLERRDQRDKYDIYWMAENIKTFMELRKQKKPVLFKYGLLSIKIYKNADLWVLANWSKMDLPPIMRDKYFHVRKIQLWHGVGPKGLNLTGAYDEFEAWCCASEYTKNRHMALWNAPPEKLYVTGMARLDRLYMFSIYNEKLKAELGLPDKKIILYAPTFETGLWPEKWGIKYFEKLIRFIEEQDIILILRAHAYASGRNTMIKKIAKKAPNVFFKNVRDEPDLMKLLSVTDILITDWSSLYTDFLLLERPVIFIEIDTEKFTKERGLNLVEPTLRPGYKIKRPDELMPTLKEALIRNPYKNYQKKIFNLIHGGWNGNASEKVLKVIEKILQGSE